MKHRSDNSWSRRASALSVSALALCASAANAQQAPQPDPVGSDDIVVTARKTSERLQDVPISVSAVTGDQLRDRGAVDLKDVLRSVPGVSFSGTERGQSNYNIRGVSTVASSPTVGLYLDDISLVTVATSFSGGFDPVFFDMERLEVLKGPQGTLYGGSAMGGAIKYVSARPDSTRFGVNTAAGLAGTEHGALSYHAEVVANIPVVTDKLAVRAGFSYLHDGGYIDNAPGNIVNAGRSSSPSPTYVPLVRDSLSTRQEKNQNYGDTYVGRFSVEWQPDQSWTIRPQVFWQDYKIANASVFFPNQPGLQSSYRLPQPIHDEAAIYSLNIEKDFGGVQVTSLTAYFDRKLDYSRDYSFFVGNLVPSFYPLNTNNISTSRTKTFSQELRIGSTGSGQRFKWLAGLYYSDQNDRLIQTVTTQLASPLVVYGGNTFTGTKQYAAFGEATLTLFDGFDLTAGARAFKIDQSVDIFATGPLASPANITGLKSRDEGINPKFGVSYKASPNNLIYASAAKGFRQGGPQRQVISTTVCGADFALYGLTAAPTTFEPDTLWSYELGSKNNFGGNKVMLNVSAFYTDWKKIQQAVTLGCGFTLIANVGSAQIKGLEAEGRVNLTRDLQIGGNATYTDARLTSVATALGEQVGDQPLSVPKWMASAYVGYSTELPHAWRLSLRGEYQYQSSARRMFQRTFPVVYSNGLAGPARANAAEFRQAYDVVNASASLTHEGTELRLYMNNMLDSRPLLDFYQTSGNDSATTIRPRTLGIELRQKF